MNKIRIREYLSDIPNVTLPERMPVLCKHNKTGNLYFLLGIIINATNKDDGQLMGLYQSLETGECFVRELHEYFIKFTLLDKVEQLLDSMHTIVKDAFSDKIGLWFTNSFIDEIKCSQGWAVGGMWQNTESPLTIDNVKVFIDTSDSKEVDLITLPLSDLEEIKQKEILHTLIKRNLYDIKNGIFNDNTKQPN